MPQCAPSLEAIALVRAMLDELEARAVEEQAAVADPESATEQEDREAAAAWAARHRLRDRQQRQGKRIASKPARRKAG